MFATYLYHKYESNTMSDNKYHIYGINLEKIGEQIPDIDLRFVEFEYTGNHFFDGFEDGTSIEVEILLFVYRLMDSGSWEFPPTGEIKNKTIYINDLKYFDANGDDIPLTTEDLMDLMLMIKEKVIV
jgi:hypothetical protein